MDESDETRASVRELVLMDSASALRWFQHDYPHPLARWHHHPEIEIHLITDSSGTAQIGGAARAFAPGAFYLIGSGLPHNWVSSVAPERTVPGRDMLIQVDPGLLTELSGRVPDLARVPKLLQMSRHGIEYFGATREHAATLLEEIGHRRGIRRFTGMLDLLDLLMDAPSEEREVISETAVITPLEQDDSDRFDQAMSFVHERLHDSLRLADVAEALDMSPAHVSRLFSRATGVGFARTLIRLRVSEACRLLLMTDHPVADICYSAGFTNLSNFNRRFREETGTTPRAYRSSRPTQ